MRLLLDLLALIRALAADRARLALENLVLRQQLNVLRRSVKRARLDDSDRGGRPARKGAYAALILRRISTLIYSPSRLIRRASVPILHGGPAHLPRE